VVVDGAHTAKMVEGSRKDKHILVNKRLNDERVSTSGATPELLPLGKVMGASTAVKGASVQHLDKREETG
jgi:hypothetical protein